MLLGQININLIGESRWGDVCVSEDNVCKNRLMEMSDIEWNARVQHCIKHKQGDLRDILNWTDRVEQQRKEYRSTSVTIPIKEKENSDFKLWVDMVEEPEKYGDDITEWLELNDRLYSGPDRERIDTYWENCRQEQLQKDGEHLQWLLETAVKNYKNRMATRIQAAIRGYQTREKIGNRFNCGYCLAHCALFHNYQNNWVCINCANHLDIT